MRRIVNFIMSYLLYALSISGPHIKSGLNIDVLPILSCKHNQSYISTYCCDLTNNFAKVFLKNLK